MIFRLQSCRLLFRCLMHQKPLPCCKRFPQPLRNTTRDLSTSLHLAKPIIQKSHTRPFHPLLVCTPNQRLERRYRRRTYERNHKSPETLHFFTAWTDLHYISNNHAVKYLSELPADTQLEDTTKWTPDTVIKVLHHIAHVHCTLPTHTKTNGFVDIGISDVLSDDQRKELVRLVHSLISWVMTTTHVMTPKQSLDVLLALRAIEMDGCSVILRILSNTNLSIDSMDDTASIIWLILSNPKTENNNQVHAQVISLLSSFQGQPSNTLTFHSCAIFLWVSMKLGFAYESFIRNVLDVMVTKNYVMKMTRHDLVITTAAIAYHRRHIPHTLKRTLLGQIQTAFFGITVIQFEPDHLSTFLSAMVSLGVYNQQLFEETSVYFERHGLQMLTPSLLCNILKSYADANFKERWIFRDAAALLCEDEKMGYLHAMSIYEMRDLLCAFAKLGLSDERVIQIATRVIQNRGYLYQAPIRVIRDIAAVVGQRYWQGCDVFGAHILNVIQTRRLVTSLNSAEFIRIHQSLCFLEVPRKDTFRFLKLFLRFRKSRLNLCSFSYIMRECSTVGRYNQPMFRHMLGIIKRRRLIQHTNDYCAMIDILETTIKESVVDDSFFRLVLGKIRTLFNQQTEFTASHVSTLLHCCAASQTRLSTRDVGMLLCLITMPSFKDADREFMVRLGQWYVEYKHQIDALLPHVKGSRDVIVQAKESVRRPAEDFDHYTQAQICTDLKKRLKAVDYLSHSVRLWKPYFYMGMVLHCVSFPTKKCVLVHGPGDYIYTRTAKRANKKMGGRAELRLARLLDIRCITKRGLKVLPVRATEWNLMDDDKKSKLLQKFSGRKQ